MEDKGPLTEIISLYPNYEKQLRPLQLLDPYLLCMALSGVVEFPLTRPGRNLPAELLPVWVHRLFRGIRT
ncbi:hypothetical protein chiPu_0023279, partial [Chiloscyllium punctatum]|nr:hypothetical protein [Chiloscyllium punctatum]